MTTIASTQHTPGPWYVAEEHPSRNGITTPDSFRHLCVSTPRGDITCFQGYGRGDIECEANARLITAAPDLLAACQAVLDWARTPGNHGGNPYMMQHVSLAREAVAAATGQQDDE